MKESLYLVFGPPAAGKTTFAHEFCKETSSEYLSVGNITRAEIAQRTKRGKELRKYLDLILQYPTALIGNLVEEYISNTSSDSILLDGYPKYPNEAEYFRNFLKGSKIKSLYVITIDLPLEIVLERAKGRRICESCLQQQNINIGGGNCVFCKEGKLIQRDDDTEPILKRRFHDYLESFTETFNILEPFIKKRVLVKGDCKMEEIVRNVLECTNFARVAQQRERLYGLQEDDGSSPSSGS